MSGYRPLIESGHRNLSTILRQIGDVN